MLPLYTLLGAEAAVEVIQCLIGSAFTNLFW